MKINLKNAGKYLIENNLMDKPFRDFSEEEILNFFAAGLPQDGVYIKVRTCEYCPDNKTYAVNTPLCIQFRTEKVMGRCLGRSPQDKKIIPSWCPERGVRKL